VLDGDHKYRDGRQKNSKTIQLGRKLHRDRNFSTWKWGGNDHDDIEYISTVEEKKMKNKK
jgi:hypothetical protein